MKKLLLLPLVFIFAPTAKAEITASYTTSAQIQVEMPYVITKKAGSTYSLSGSNITPSVTIGDTTTSNKIGGLNLGSLTNGVPARASP